MTCTLNGILEMTEESHIPDIIKPDCSVTHAYNVLRMLPTDNQLDHLTFVDVTGWANALQAIQANDCSPDIVRGLARSYYTSAEFAGAVQGFTGTAFDGNQIWANHSQPIDIVLSVAPGPGSATSSPTKTSQSPAAWATDE